MARSMETEPSFRLMGTSTKEHGRKISLQDKVSFIIKTTRYMLGV